MRGRVAQEHASAPLAMGLFVPGAWATVTARRAACHVPATGGHQPRWQIALDLIRELDLQRFRGTGRRVEVLTIDQRLTAAGVAGEEGFPVPIPTTDTPEGEALYRRETALADGAGADAL